MIHKLRTIGFQELGVFMAVVEQGGVTAAASELKMAKSAVSTQLSKLEDRLGLKLLNRSSRRVTLTPEGRRLLPRVESLLAEGERLLQEAALEESSPSGVVSMAATPEFCQLVLTKFLPQLRSALPEIRTVIKTAHNFEDLQDPSFDLAFRMNRVKDDRLVARRLGSYRRFFYAAPSLAKSRELEHPADLARVPCLVFASDTLRRVWSARHVDTGERVDVEINAAMGVQNFSTLAAMAASGVGVCYVPNFVAREQVKAGRLKRVMPDWSAKQSDVFLVYRPGVARIARVSAVLKHVNSELPKLLDDVAR
ncbi:MAG: LysR family transcriptional regulator [Pseudomonadota bacterium]